MGCERPEEGLKTRGDEKGYFIAIRRVWLGKGTYLHTPSSGSRKLWTHRATLRWWNGLR